MDSFYGNYAKRALDIALSLIALPFAAAAIALLAPAIKLYDHGPVFYNAERRGKGGRVFTMYKLRSMKVNSPDIRCDDGSTYNSAHDSRVTPIGRIMRKTSLDELPQVFNVLMGDMSIVGPRPTLATKPYDDCDELRRKRFAVLPGITGYSQAFFRNSAPSEQKLQNDCYYVDHLSFAMDVKIILKTVSAVLLQKNVNVKTKEPVAVYDPVSKKLETVAGEWQE